MPDRLDKQATQLSEWLSMSGLSAEEMAARVLIKPDSMRKIVKGYQPASKRLLELIKTVAEKEALRKGGVAREKEARGEETSGRVAEEPRVFVSYQGGARAMVQARREAIGLTHGQLAKMLGTTASVVREIEGGFKQPGEDLIERMSAVLEIPKDRLMGGSDSPRLLGAGATYGSKPRIVMPGRNLRYVPLLSWAQAGTMNAGFVDDAYDYGGVISIDIKDPQAFGVEIRGNSMEPRIVEGDNAIACPNLALRSGDTVICRTVDGDVMCKLYQPKQGGELLILSSYNPAFPPVELRREEVAWIYPVGQVVQNLRKE